MEEQNSRTNCENIDIFKGWEKFLNYFANKALHLLLQYNCWTMRLDTWQQTNSFKMKGSLMEFADLQQRLFCLFIYPERLHCPSSLKNTIIVSLGKVKSNVLQAA